MICTSLQFVIFGSSIFQSYYFGLADDEATDSLAVQAHKFAYQESPSDTTAYPVEALVQAGGNSKDFFYALLGHPSNKLANKLQLTSFRALSKILISHSVAHKGSIYNNDIDQPMQHEYEQTSYFGSQDWVLDYGAKELGINWEHPLPDAQQYFESLGVQCHFWKDCIASVVYTDQACIHMLQVRNTQHFWGVNVTTSDMLPVFEWMHSYLQAHSGQTTLIVFQEFNDHLDQLIVSVHEFLSKAAAPEKSEEEQSNVATYNILAIVFTLMANDASFKQQQLCHGNTRIPIVSMGSLPAESYLLLQFNSFEYFGSKQIYRLDILHGNATIIRSMTKPNLYSSGDSCG